MASLFAVLFGLRDARAGRPVYFSYYTGGRTTVSGTLKEDLQKNSRAGLTLALPVGRRHSVKLSWATGATTRIGGDFQTLAVADQFLWF